jgi:hypothetical protein
MMKKATTAGEAQWIIEKMLAEKRISADDIRGYLADMRKEIADIEQRLLHLRARGGSTAAPQMRSAAAPAARRKKTHARGLAGTLAVLLRSVPAAEHAAIAQLRAKHGIKAAIAAARVSVRKD